MNNIRPKIRPQGQPCNYMLASVGWVTEFFKGNLAMNILLSEQPATAVPVDLRVVLFPVSLRVRSDMGSLAWSENSYFLRACCLPWLCKWKTANCFNCQVAGGFQNSLSISSTRHPKIQQLCRENKQCEWHCEEDKALCHLDYCNLSENLFWTSAKQLIR